MANKSKRCCYHSDFKKKSDFVALCGFVCAFNAGYFKEKLTYERGWHRIYPVTEGHNTLSFFKLLKFGRLR